MTPDAIEKDILINAPAETVYRVITEPAQIARWFADAADLDPVPGGQGSLTFEDRATSQRMSVRLTVQAAEPPNRFAFRWDYPEGEQPREGNSLLVEFTLPPRGPGPGCESPRAGLPPCAGRTRRSSATSRRTTRAGTPTWPACRTMSQGSPEPGDRDLPPGEDELREAVADPSRRKVLDLILARGQATLTMAAAAARWDRRLHAIKRLAEEQASTSPARPPPAQQRLHRQAAVPLSISEPAVVVLAFRNVHFPQMREMAVHDPEEFACV